MKLTTLLLLVACVAVLFACKSKTNALGQQSAQYETVDNQTFSELLLKTNILLVDVRTEKEFAESHLRDALNIDVQKDDFISQAKRLLGKKKWVAVYCRSGRRSAHAAELLVKNGYKVVNLSGGILGWTAEGREVVK